jgi:hypothetical protein
LSSATIVRAANRGQIAESEIVEDRFGLSLRRDLAIRPASRASLKDKPYYDEVMRELSATGRLQVR